MSWRRSARATGWYVSWKPGLRRSTRAVGQTPTGGASTRAARARPIGADGSQLLEWVRTADTPRGLRERPALEARRCRWLQHYDRWTVPGHEESRWRTGDAQPPSALRMASPDDLEARYSRKRDGLYGASHRDLCCRLAQSDHPSDPHARHHAGGCYGPPIHRALAPRDLLPGTHLLDSGCVEADLLVTAQTHPQLDVVGPRLGSSYSRQRQDGQGYALQAFVVD
jgi:hypothetical protein